MTGPTIAVITALPKEHAAFSRLLVDAKDIKLHNDPTLYKTGYVPAQDGVHHVVLACLTKYGNNTAAITATNIRRSFETISDILLVGICAGVPRPKNPSDHVRLGDVILASGQGIVQFDMGALTEGGFKPRPASPPPSANILQAVNMLESASLIDPELWPRALTEFLADAGVRRPTREPKRPFKHPLDKSRRPGMPKILRGKIGASNSLIKDATKRNQIADEHKLMGFEMEGSGVADAAWDGSLGYYVVRSSCDYGDKSKDDSWQEYAAHVAACFAGLLLRHLPSGVPEAINEAGSPGVRERGNRESAQVKAYSAQDIGQTNAHPAGGEPTRLSADRLTCVEWLTDSSLCCGGFSGNLVLTDDAGQSVRTISVSPQVLRDLMVLSENAVLVTGDSGVVSHVDLSAGKVSELCRLDGAGYCLAEGRSEQTFLTGDRTGAVREWTIAAEANKLRARETRLPLTVQKAAVFSLVRDGDLCFSAGAEGAVYKSSLATGDTQQKKLSDAAIFCLDVSDGGSQIYGGSASGDLHMLEGLNERYLSLHTDAIRSLQLTRTTLFTGSKDGTVRSLDLESKRSTLRWSSASYVYQIKLSPSGARLAIATGGGELSILPARAS